MQRIHMSCVFKSRAPQRALLRWDLVDRRKLTPPSTNNILFTDAKNRAPHPSEPVVMLQAHTLRVPGFRAHRSQVSDMHRLYQFDSIAPCQLNSLHPNSHPRFTSAELYAHRR